LVEPATDMELVAWHEVHEAGVGPSQPNVLYEGQKVLAEHGWHAREESAY
jgi:hypothetical protein